MRRALELAPKTRAAGPQLNLTDLPNDDENFEAGGKVPATPGTNLRARHCYVPEWHNSTVAIPPDGEIHRKIAGL